MVRDRINRIPFRKRVFAGFLPDASARHLQSVIRLENLALASSWTELDSMIRSYRFEAALIDPGADGTMNTRKAIQILRSHPYFPILAYVPVNPWQLKAVAALANNGLPQVLLHPARDSDREFWKPLERLSADWLAREFLGSIEASLGQLPFALYQAIEDLFSRPDRYQTGPDIAAQAGVSIKSLYRSFEAVHLGTPKKLVTAAKLVRAYCLLRQMEYPASVSRRIGCSDVEVLSSHTKRIFGCTPAELAADPKSDEVVRQLLEWYYKPMFIRIDSVA
jgi:AraC-like DNA-binding protein